MADGAGVGAFAKNEADGVDEDGFARAGFAREDVEAGAKMDGGFFDDGEVFSVDCNRSGNEKTMLEHFYSHVFDMVCTEYHGGIASQNLTVCGHNVAGFDLPFIKHRSIILGVKPPVAMLKAMSAKPWDTCIADTMLMWSSDSQKRASMDKLCKAFSLEGKGDFDGSMVAETWPVDPQKVIDYCKDDVRRTRAMYKRMTFDTYAPAMELAA